MSPFVLHVFWFKTHEAFTKVIRMQPDRQASGVYDLFSDINSTTDNTAVAKKLLSALREAQRMMVDIYGCNPYTPCASVLYELELFQQHYLHEIHNQFHSGLVAFFRQSPTSAENERMA
jgi:hypothetical protein